MSERPLGDDWWLAADGKWYPPTDRPPAPGWWLASDAQWYPPQPQPPAQRYPRPQLPRPQPPRQRQASSHAMAGDDFVARPAGAAPPGRRSRRRTWALVAAAMGRLRRRLRPRRRPSHG